MSPAPPGAPRSASKRSPSGDASGSESSGSGSGSGSVRIRSGPCAAGGGILATISSGHASSHDRALQQAVQMNGSVKMSEIPTSREGSPAPRPRHRRGAGRERRQCEGRCWPRHPRQWWLLLIPSSARHCPALHCCQPLPSLAMPCLCCPSTSFPSLPHAARPFLRTTCTRCCRRRARGSAGRGSGHPRRPY